MICTRRSIWNRQQQMGPVPKFWLGISLVLCSLCTAAAFCGGTMQLRPQPKTSSSSPSSLSSSSYRPCRSVGLRCSSADTVGDIKAQAAKAMREAEEAERRLTSLKESAPPPKQAVAARPPARVEQPEMELMNEEDLAKEMSALLGGLQQRGAGGKSDPLQGSKWALDLDFGREKGTWMDAKWGASGRRVKRGLAIEFGRDGKICEVEGHSFGLKQKLTGVKGGEWKVEGAFPGEKVKFWVDQKGFSTEESGCDIDLPAGQKETSHDATSPTTIPLSVCHFPPRSLLLPDLSLRYHG